MTPNWYPGFHVLSVGAHAATAYSPFRLEFYTSSATARVRRNISGIPKARSLEYYMPSQPTFIGFNLDT